MKANHAALAKELANIYWIYSYFLSGLNANKLYNTICNISTQLPTDRTKPCL